MFLIFLLLCVCFFSSVCACSYGRVHLLVGVRVLCFESCEAFSARQEFGLLLLSYVQNGTSLGIRMYKGRLTVCEHGGRCFEMWLLYGALMGAC